MEEPHHSQKPCEECGKPTIIHILRAKNRKWIKEHTFCEEHGNEFHVRLFTPEVIGSFSARPLKTSWEFDIEMLIRRKDSWNSYFYLREKDGHRLFANQLGFPEAVALYWNIHSGKSPNPRCMDSFLRRSAILAATFDMV